MPNYSTLGDHTDEDKVLIHEAELSSDRFSLINDLDAFFSRIYQYHQRHGFSLILLALVLELAQFVFIIFLAVYLYHGVNYQLLFKEGKYENHTEKVKLNDVMLPIGETVSDFGGFTWFALIFAAIFWIFKSMKGIYHLFHFWEIKHFYNTVLKIHDSQLDNLTWYDVQTRLQTVQKERTISIHKQELTELDIYHRILRQENYFVAMTNKKLIPPILQIPFLGEMVYWTSGLRLNMQILFFWSPFSPFVHPWQLKDEYKKPQMRQELTQKFKQQVMFLGLFNLLLSPIILAWQLYRYVLTYGAVIRKEPGVLAFRRWSLYGKLYLRHFNELDHELQARLTRAHRPASKYMAAFYSPFSNAIVEGVGFYVAAILTIFILMSVYDEDVINVEHVLLILTTLGLGLTVLRSTLQDDTEIWNLEDLLNKVLMHTHYLPPGCKGQAHTEETRKKIQQLFQYSFAAILESILSPILTAYVLLKHIYPRSIEYVDFFRNFTINVAAVGDVCSFALMDLPKHGNPKWHKVGTPVPDQYSQCEDGKLEISLVHFKSTNPNWVPPESVQEFVKRVENRSLSATSPSTQNYLEGRCVPNLLTDKAEELSLLPPLATVDAAPSYTLDVWRNNATYQSNIFQEDFSSQIHPTQVSNPSLSLRRRIAPETMHISRMFSAEGNSPFSFVEMSLTAEYLHALHNNMNEDRLHNTAQETTPLLK